MKTLIPSLTAVLIVVAIGACTSKNANNDINESEILSGRSASAMWSTLEGKWTRIEPWDGSCPEVSFSSDNEGNFKSEGCGGLVTGRLSSFEFNRLNDAANALVPSLSNSEICDLQKTPDLKVEEALTTREDTRTEFLFSSTGGRTCRRGEFQPVTSLARILLEIQLKYEVGLPRPIPTPTPEPTPTPSPIPLPPEPVPLPTATPRPPDPALT